MDCWAGPFTFVNCCLGVVEPPTLQIDPTPPAVVCQQPRRREQEEQNEEKEQQDCQPQQQQQEQPQPPELECWDGVWTADFCCDRSVSPEGRQECWVGPYTFWRCCDGRYADAVDFPKPQTPSALAETNAPPCRQLDWPTELCCRGEISPELQAQCWGGGRYSTSECCSCEAAFFSCARCLELLELPTLGRAEWEWCKEAGHAVFAHLPWEGMAPYMLCVPAHPYCQYAEIPALLESIKHSRGDISRLRVADCGKVPWSAANCLTLTTAVFPAFLARLQRFRKQRGSLPKPDSRMTVHEGRQSQADVVRVLATAAAIALHLNIADQPNPTGPRHVRDVDRFPRCTDAFIVLAAVMLANQPCCSVGNALDRLWRKLSRQLPVFLFPFHMLTDVWCPRPMSCCSSCMLSGSWELTLSSRLVFRWMWRSAEGAVEGDPWPFTVDLWIQMVLLALLATSHCGGHRAFRAASALVAAWSLKAACEQGPSYFAVSAYRLPMALLMFCFARCRRIFAGMARWPWLSRAVVALLLCAGLSCPVDDLPKKSVWRLSGCYFSGSRFLLAGLSFHLGVLGVCQCPGILPLVPAVQRLSRSSFIVLVVHQHFLEMLRRCQKSTAAPWVFYESGGLFTYITGADYQSHPWTRAWLCGTAVVAGCFVASELIASLVQRPWTSFLARVPSKIRHSLAALYIVMVIWDATPQR